MAGAAEHDGKHQAARKLIVRLVSSARVSLDISSSKTAILTSFSGIFLKNIETFLVFLCQMFKYFSIHSDESECELLEQIILFFFFF